MRCCYCYKRLRFWQKHNGASHDLCCKVHDDGWDKAWQRARETLWSWNLPSIDQLFATMNVQGENGGMEAEILVLERWIAARKPVVELGPAKMLDLNEQIKRFARPVPSDTKPAGIQSLCITQAELDAWEKAEMPSPAVEWILAFRLQKKSEVADA